MNLDWLTAWLAHMPAMALVMARIGSLIVSAPVIGGAYVPGTVKSLLTVAMALVLAPHIDQRNIPLDLSFFLLIVREVLLGLSLGWLLSLYSEAVRMGGELINRHAGFSAAENFDPDSNIGAGPMGDIMHFGFLLLLLITNGHLMILSSIAHSFDLIPLGAWSPSPELGTLLGHSITEAWAIALAISFPVLSAVMAITLVEGVMTRAIPQINVLHISFGVKILVSVGVVYAGMPTVIAFLGTVIVVMHTTSNALMGM